MTTDADRKLRDDAMRVVGDAAAKLYPLTHTETGWARSDATLDDVERVIREVARELNEWLLAYDDSGGDAEKELLEETLRRELDRRQPEA